jgi:hypothetical protein
MCIAVEVTEGTEEKDFVDPFSAACDLRGMDIISGSQKD